MNRKKTLNRSLAFRQGFYFLREGEKVQDEQQNVLYQAAAVWKDLMNYRYILTYGCRNKSYEINLTFSADEFSHLAGFQYLKDISLPRYNSRKIVDMILSGKITYKAIQKGMQYREMVEPRLLALVRLKEVLEQDFELFSYVPNLYPFVTKIKADYIISSQNEPTAFVLLSKNPLWVMLCVTSCVVLPLRRVTATTAQTSVPAPCSRKSGYRLKPLTR